MRLGWAGLGWAGLGWAELVDALTRHADIGVAVLCPISNIAANTHTYTHKQTNKQTKHKKKANVKMK